MTMSANILSDGYDRVKEVVHDTVDGLTEEELTFRVGPRANTIAWLIWHLTRVQDDHIAHVAGLEQVWTSGGWFERFGLPFDKRAHGYGQSSDEVAQVTGIPAEQLIGYHDAVHAQTIGFIAGLSDEDLERIVDTRWDPPVTLAARLVSVIADDLQHAGQAAYVKGLI